MYRGKITIKDNIIAGKNKYNFLYNKATKGG